MTTSSDLLSTGEMARRSGLSLRQLDHWDRLGIIEPAIPGDGSGSHRRWSAFDVDRFRAMAAVSRMTNGRLPNLLRRIAETDRPWVFVTDGFRISIEPIEPIREERPLTD